MLPYRFVLIILLTLLASCGGGGGESKPKPEPVVVENTKFEIHDVGKKGRNWIAVDDDISTSTDYSMLELVPYYIGGPEVTVGDPEWRISKGEEYASVIPNTRITKVTADAPCPEETPFCVTVELKYTKADGTTYFAYYDLIVKQTEDNWNPKINIVPVEEIAGGEEVILNASGTIDYDGDTSKCKYNWQLQKGLEPITIKNSDKSQASFEAPENKHDEQYIIRLTVTDDKGGVSTETVTVTIKATIENIPPQAQADNVEYHQLTKVILDGSKSSDEDDGTEDLQYLWQQTDTDNLVTINNSDKEVADFMAPEVEEELILNFRLTVTDPDGAKNSIDIKVKIKPDEENLSPVAKPEFISVNNSEIAESAKVAVSDDKRITTIKINEETPVCIQGNKSNDPEDKANITYLWDDPAEELDGINQNNSNQQQICFTTPKLTEEKEIEITLTVTDTETATGKSSIFLKVLPVNATPQVKAEHTIANRTVTLTDISEDDGSIESCEWRQNQNDTVKVTITGSDKCKATFPEPITKEGTTLFFYLTVTDDEGMTVTNESPYEIAVTAVDLTPQNAKVEHTYNEETASSKLIWSDVTQNLNMEETTYKIYWSTTPNITKQTPDSFTVANLTSKELTDLSPNTAYYYRVTSAYPDGTESELSNEAAYLPATTKLYLTEDIKEITIKWDAVTGADSYLVSWNEEDGQPQENVVNTNTYTDTDTTAGNRYNYRIIPIRNIDGVEHKGIRSVEKGYYARGNYWINASSDMAVSWSCGYSGLTAEYGGKKRVICLEQTESSDGYKNISIMQYDWETGISQKITELPEGRMGSNFATAVSDDKIYFAGGVRKDGNNDYVDVFNFTTMEWEEKIQVPEIGGSTGIMTTSTEDLVIEDSKLIIINYSRTHCEGGMCPMIYFPPTIQIKVVDMVDLELICSQSYGGAVGDYGYLDGLLYVRKSNGEFLSIDLAQEECPMQIQENIPEDFPVAGTMRRAFDPTLGFDILIYRGHQENEDGSTTPEVWKFHPLAQWYRVAASGKELYDPIGSYSIFNFEDKLIISNLYSASDTIFSRTEIFNLQTESWDRKDSGMSPRSVIATAKHNGKIYLNGGKGIKVNSFERFNPETSEFEKLPSNELWRAGHSAITVDDSIYLIGGYSVFESSPVFETEKYDINTKIWEKVATKPSVRIGECNVEVDGFIYSIGGQVYDFDTAFYPQISEEDKAVINRYVEVFDPQNNEWFVKSSAQLPSSLLSQEKNGTACAVVGKNIYVFGGFNEENPEIKQVEIYNTETNTWATDTELMPEALSYMGNTNNIVINDKVYLMGGVKNPTAPNMLFSAAVLRYSPDNMNDKWKMVEDIPQMATEILGESIDGEAYYSAIALDGVIYKFGGVLFMGESEILSPIVSKFR